VRIAFATCADFPDGIEDERPAAALLGADWRCWSDPAVNWQSYDRVVVRSTWDYTLRVGKFLQWCRAVGTERLRNSPELIAFNADKRYLAQLDCPTVEQGDLLPDLQGAIVVKPNVSGGARNTGLFSPATHELARELIERIRGVGGTALVQPYIEAVASGGETALVFLGGELSHVLHKRAVLAPDEIAPTLGEDGPALAMLDDDLVVAGDCTPAQRALADGLLSEIGARFGQPLYARVDLVDGPDGYPLLMELEVIEPALYLHRTAGGAERLAAAVRAG
jgi:hypothetical protein